MSTARTVTDRPLVNIVVACRIVCRSRRTIERWMKAQLVEWVRVPSGHRLIYADTLFTKPNH